MDIECVAGPYPRETEVGNPEGILIINIVKQKLVSINAGNLTARTRILSVHKQ